MKESRHIESKYLAARVLELLALGLRVCASWSRVLLKGVLRMQVAPIPEGRRKELIIFCGLASGDSLFLRVDQRCVSHISFHCVNVDLSKMLLCTRILFKATACFSV